MSESEIERSLTGPFAVSALIMFIYSPLKKSTHIFASSRQNKNNLRYLKSWLVTCFCKDIFHKNTVLLISS